MMFDRLCATLAARIGRPGVFVACCVLVLLAIAAAMVPEWRESVNTWGGAITGYVSILLLIILQNSQNREGAALHLKLDSLVIAAEGVSNKLAGIEAHPIEEIRAEAEQIRTKLDNPT